MKTVIDAGIMVGVLLLFPEVRLFKRRESPSPVKGVFQGKMSVLNFDFYFLVLFFSVVKDNLKCFFI